MGYADAVNVTDNPVASAHMSPLAGVAAVARAGLEPTVQLTVRDRNRLALAGDLLGAWALGARNLFALTGDPSRRATSRPPAAVHDLTVLELIGLARTLRDEQRLPSGQEVDPAPLVLRRRVGYPARRGVRPGPARGQARRRAPTS